MPNFVRTAEAENDLLDIWVHVSKQSIQAADRLYDTLNAKCQMLAAFPEMGERCESLAPGLRRFVVGNYLLFYRPIADGIAVIHVLQGSRDIQAVFRRE